MALIGKYAKTHAKQIAKANSWLDSAQAQFASALEDASIAEKKIDSVVADAETKIAELQAVVDKANAHKEQAVKFKNKIQSFLD